MMDQPGQSEYWTFWQVPAAKNPRWKAEAYELVRRLSASNPPLPTWRLLDFGCGQGLVAALLSPSVNAVDLWDSSPVARKQAQEVCKIYPNINVLTQLPANAIYDFILVSSVTQYMTEHELKEALALWKQVLKPHGQVLITDIIQPRRRIASEIYALIRFAMRYKLLFRMLVDGFHELPRYWRRSRQRPLTHFAPEKIAVLASAAGFELQQVTNPNLFPSRYAVLLRLGRV